MVKVMKSLFHCLQEEKEREELAGANKVSDPRKKGSKDDKRKGETFLYKLGHERSRDW